MSATPIPFTQFIEDNANPGTYNANGNYSVTPASFRLSAAADQVIEVHRLIVTIRDGSAFSAEKYGGITGGLSTGVKIYFRDSDDSLLYDVTGSGHAIQANADWGSFCYDVDLKSWGSGDSFLLVRWTAARSFGVPFTIRPGQYVEVYLNDDLSGLIAHYFQMQGIIYDQDPE